MIDTLFFANYFEQQFNNNTQGRKFLIFADEGNLRKSTKYGNKVKQYTHGLLEVISSQVTPIKNLKFQTWDLQLMIIADLNWGGVSEHGEYEREQSNNLIAIKQCIGEVIDRLNGQTMTISDADRTYSMTIGFDLPTDGQKMSLGEISEGLPLYLTISITLFENGVNGNEYELIVDGENIYFTKSVFTRIKITEQNPDWYSSTTKASVQSNGMSIDLTMPQLTTNLCEKLEDEMLSGEDKAYSVIVKRGSKRIPFICTTGKTQQSIENAINIGFNLSFIEPVPELLEYDKNKWITLEKEVLESEIESVFKNTSSEEICIFWGDGTKEITNELNIAHMFKEPGNYNIYAYCPQATSDGWFSEIINRIIYELNGGIADNPTSYNNNDLPITLNNPTRTGYNFTGWTGTDLNSPTMVVTIPQGSFGTKTYIAHWQIIEYPISYNYNGGEVATENVSTYNIETEAFTLNNPSKTGYSFLGWTGTDLSSPTISVTIPKGSTGERQYTSNWQPIEYTITYNNISNPNLNRTSYNIETETFSLNNPSDQEDGQLIFKGWSGTDIEGLSTNVTIAKGSTGDRVYTANWEYKTYTMLYDADDGSAIPPYVNPTSKQVTFNNSIGSLYNPAHLEKTVNGTKYIGYKWQIDGEDISSSTIWSWKENKTAKITWTTIPGV